MHEEGNFADLVAFPFVARSQCLIFLGLASRDYRIFRLPLALQHMSKRKDALLLLLGCPRVQSIEATALSLTLAALGTASRQTPPSSTGQGPAICG